MSDRLIIEGLKALREQGVGKRSLSEQKFLKNIIKKEPKSSGDFLANYVTSGQAGKNVFNPDKINPNNPLDLIKLRLKMGKFTSGPFLTKPVPGRKIPGSTASPVDDPTGQGLPGGQTAQSTNDLTFGDMGIVDTKDPKNRYYPTKGRENIEAEKKYLEDRYGPDVDKGYRAQEAAYKQSKDYKDMMSSTLSQNNIYPQDTRGPTKKVGDTLNRLLRKRGNINPTHRDPTKIKYSVF